MMLTRQVVDTGYQHRMEPDKLRISKQAEQDSQFVE